MAKDQGVLSGFRDLMTPEVLAREKVIKTVTEIFELYGFMPIKTPALEKYETLGGKYGDEATTLMYDFKDRGDRHIALRYDHTVPLARLMAAHGNSQLLPYKRYVVGDVWRGESPQAGRYREFTQIDADIVGSTSWLADSEMLSMMADTFSALNMKVTISLNDRRLLDGLAESCGIKEPSSFYRFIGLIDKASKIGAEAVLEEIAKSFGNDTKNKVLGLFNKELTLDNIAELIPGTKAQEALSNIQQILSVLDSERLKIVKFDPTIARGLNYYTSTIFETLADKAPSLGSLCSGGRYDKLIASLGGPDLSAIGTSIGLDRLMDADRELNLTNGPKTKTLAGLVNLDDSLNKDRLALANELRSAGISVEVYYGQDKLGKQLETISKLGIKLALIYGPNEKDKGLVLVKDLETSEQREVKLSELSKELQRDN